MTGSVYHDYVFAGSKVCPVRTKLFIVKTHRTDNSLKLHRDCVEMGITKLDFSSAIYIIRNPYNAILAEFNRQHNDLPQIEKGMYVAPKESFNTSGKLSSDYIFSLLLVHSNCIEPILSFSTDLFSKTITLYFKVNLSCI